MSNEPKVRTLRDYLDLVRRRWVYPATVLPAAILSSVYLAYSIPPLYRSTATIMLEASSIPADMIQTTVTSYADQQFELVRRQVMTPQSLVEVVQRTDPYPDLDVSDNEKARYIADSTSVERVDPITLEPLKESTAFSLQYDNPDPEVAAAVTQRLADLFLAYNRETRTAQAEQAYEFLSSKAEQLEVTARGFDERIAEFKRNNASALPEDAIRNEAGVERAQREYDDVLAEIRSAEQREGALAVQLSQLSPSLVGAVTDPRTELADMKAKLAEAQQRYTPDHPTVRQLQKSIAAALERVGSGAQSGDAAADNPEYLRVRSDLESARRDLSGLRAQAARTRNDLNSYRDRLLRAPGVEPEYLQLQRERQVVQEQLEDTRRKLRDAFFAQQFEEEQRGDRYALIRPPYPADAPHSPNRIGFLLLGLVLGAALAFGIAIVVDVADPNVRGMDDVRLASDLSILAAIPVMLNEGQHRRRRLALTAACALYLAATLIAVWTVVRQVSREADASEQQVELAEH
jgi:succinoglycan biosynthesis transport protein ExoP